MTGHARTPARLVALVAAVVVIAGLLPAVAVAVAPSTAPTLTAPADGAHVGANPTLAWTSVAGAAKYRVQISPGPAFSTLIYNVDTYNTKATPPVDLPTGLLYWRAAGLDASNNAGPFGSATFIKDIIAGPTLQSPNDLATFAFPGQAETFSWSPVSGAKSYTLFIDDANDFIGARTYTTSGTSYTLTEPDTIDQTFYWRVQSMSTANILSAFSETRRYMVGWSATPTLVSPVNTTLTPITDVNFVWNPVVGAATYQLHVNPNRLTKVLHRAPGAKDWEVWDLDRALDRVAERIKQTRDETFVERLPNGRQVNHTPAIFSLGGATMDDEWNHLHQKLLRGLGIIAIENQARI